MNGDDASQFGEGLVYEDNIPISWRKAGTDLSPSQVVKTHQSNERVLRCFASLEEYRTDTTDEDHGHTAQELSRLEFKMNLLLDMVARLLVEHVATPVAVPVRMSGAGIRWQSPDAPAAGEVLSVDIYLNQAYPSPITLYGEVTGVAPADGGFQIELRYREMSETVRSWIEKMIFRHHRRQVAHARHRG